MVQGFKKSFIFNELSYFSASLIISGKVNPRVSAMKIPLKNARALDNAKQSMGTKCNSGPKFVTRGANMPPTLLKSEQHPREVFLTDVGNNSIA